MWVCGKVQMREGGVVRLLNARREGRCGRGHEKLLSKDRGRGARKAGKGGWRGRCREGFSKLRINQKRWALICKSRKF